MKVKLIALVVAGLFAQGASADDMFMWGGSAEVGYRGTNIDGANRNGAYGKTTSLSATNPLTPFLGPVDDAKAQEYQNINSAPIGVLDIRGSSRTSYLRAFGEEFGRDDQFINVVGGSYGVWKASLYNNDIPHNYSFNALSPVTGSDSTVQVGPGGTYPNAQNPATWHPFNYSTQREHLGRKRRVLEQVALVHQGGLQRGPNERCPARQRPARHRLGQRVDRARQARRLQDAERTNRGRLQQQAVRLQAGVPRLEVHRRERHVPMDELLACGAPSIRR